MVNVRCECAARGAHRPEHVLLRRVRRATRGDAAGGAAARAASAQPAPAALRVRARDDAQEEDLERSARAGHSGRHALLQREPAPARLALGPERPPEYCPCPVPVPVPTATQRTRPKPQSTRAYLISQALAYFIYSKYFVYSVLYLACTVDLQQKYVYDIFAVIIHKGQSANSGHYMALVRLEPNRWYLFNDETTCPYVPNKATAGGGSSHTATGGTGTGTKRIGSHKKRGGAAGCARRGAGRPALVKRVPSNSIAAAAATADGALGGALRKAVVTDQESGELEFVDLPPDESTNTLRASAGASADVSAGVGVALQDTTEAVLRSKLVSEGCYMLVYKLRASAPSSPPPRSPGAGPTFGLSISRLSHEYQSAPSISRSLSSSLKPSASTIDEYRNGTVLCEYNHVLCMNMKRVHHTRSINMN